MKYIENNAGTLTEKAALQASAGAGDANKIVATGANGRLSETLMPVGIGADTQQVQAFEALAAGDFVNVFYDGADAKVRKADASAVGKQADGFVLAAVSIGEFAEVYFEGTNDQVVGQTGGVVFLSAASPGDATAAAPAGAGNVVQRIGVATSATTVNFSSGDPIALA